jgi:hypothetical protein
MFVHQAKPIPEQGRPFAGSRLPECLECFCRRGDGFLSVCGIEFRTCANELARGGIVNFKRRARGGGGEFAVDVAFFDEEGRVLQLQ